MTSSSIIYFNQVLFGCLFYFGFYLFKLMFIYHLTCLLFFKSLGLSILIRYQHKLYALYFLLHMIAKVSGCGFLKRNCSHYVFISRSIHSSVYTSIYAFNNLFIHLSINLIYPYHRVIFSYYNYLTQTTTESTTQQ